MTYMTRANTQAEIVAEAQAVTAVARGQLALKQQAQIIALREKTGVNYSIAVGRALFHLQIVTKVGGKYDVKEVAEPMPLYEFEAFLDSFEG